MIADWRARRFSFFGGMQWSISGAGGRESPLMLFEGSDPQ